MHLFDRCVYTIIHPSRLEEAARDGESLPITEARPWVTAAKLLDEARRSVSELPIVFAHAAGTMQLLGCGVLRSIRVNGRTTTFTYAHYQELKGRRKTSLRVLSTGQPIPRDHIRPYVLCQTPDFVVRALTNVVTAGSEGRATSLSRSGIEEEFTDLISMIERLEARVEQKAEFARLHSALSQAAALLLEARRGGETQRAIPSQVPVESRPASATHDKLAAQSRASNASRHALSLGDDGAASEEDDKYFEPPPIPTHSRWRDLELERTSGTSDSRHIRVFEQTDGVDDREDATFRVWCTEIFDGEAWAFIPEAHWEDGRLHLIFPADRFRGLPSSLSLELPRRPSPGGVVRLFGERDILKATFAVRSAQDTSGAQVLERERTLQRN